MKYVFVALLVWLCTNIANAAIFPELDKESMKEYTLLKFVENSHIVVVGTVSSINEMARGGFSTDVTVRIETLIKGNPNLGKNHVIFMIRGGIGYSEAHGEMMRMHVSSEPKFEVSERVMLFLAKEDDLKTGSHKDYAHDRLHVLYHAEGKKVITTDGVKFGYVNDEKELESVFLPINLATNLAKAFTKDNSGAQKLEDEIKELVEEGLIEEVLPDTLKQRLDTAAKKIIKKAEKEN